MTCSDCGREFKKGDKIYELTLRIVGGWLPASNEERWCEDCKKKRGKKKPLDRSGIGG